MKKFNLRSMTPEEIKEANTVTVGFGPENRITSGSCERLPGGGKRYNICLGDKIDYNRPIAMVKRIGQKIKPILIAKEVWYMGIQLV